MAPFDPYRKWLGIPPDQQPVSHYRLLGIEDCESDAEVIDGAAEQRTIYLRTFQTGPNAELAERLLNEVSEARVCLLDGKSKARYDTQLKASQQPAQPVAEETVPEETPLPLVTPQRSVVSKIPSTRSRSRGGKPVWKEPWAIPAGAGGIVVLLLLLMMLFGSGEEPQDPAKQSTNTTPGNQQKAQPTAGKETLLAKAAAPLLAVAPFDVAQAKAHQQAWSKYLGVPVEYTNSIGMKFILISPGEFMMGSPKSDSDSASDEKPQHLVKITKPYYLGMTEVTQQQYEKVAGARPWQGKTYMKEGPDYPARYVSHDDAVAFCRELSQQEGVEYRLPTEAEREYACRAGTTTNYSFGDDPDKLGQYAWYRKNAFDIGEKYPHRVGQKLPNPWGLYDMHGNVSEWCQNWLAPYVTAKTVTDPKGPAHGKTRLLRGGAFVNLPMHLRSADRDSDRPGDRLDNNGFRVARTVNSAKPNTSTADTKSLSASLQQGLIAYYPFNGDAKDESGNGHHGEVDGAVLNSDRHGNTDQAYLFDGVDDFIKCPPLYERLFPLAVTAWFKTEYPAPGKPDPYRKYTVFSKPRSTRGSGLHIDIKHDRIGGGVYKGFKTTAFSPGIKEEWHHLTYVRSELKQMFFLDGQLLHQEQLKTSVPAYSQNVLIGREMLEYDVSGRSFKGSIDDVRIYNRALSADEVKALYEFESGGTAAATASDKLYLATLRPVSVGAYRFSSNGLGYAPPKLIKVNGIPSSFGITLHPRLATAHGYARYDTPLSYQLLAGAVAIEDIVKDNTPTLTFRVTAQGKTLWESTEISKHGKAIGFCIPVAEISQFELVSTCNSANNANAVWLDPVLLKSTGGKSLDQIAKEQQARWLKKEE